MGHSYTGLIGFNPRRLKGLKGMSSYATDIVSMENHLLLLYYYTERDRSYLVSPGCYYVTLVQCLETIGRFLCFFGTLDLNTIHPCLFLVSMSAALFVQITIESERSLAAKYVHFQRYRKSFRRRYDHFCISVHPKFRGFRQSMSKKTSLIFGWVA